MDLTPPLLLQGGRIFDGERFRPEEDLRVAADGTIAELGTGLRPAPGENRLELRGRWLLPGLVDCHVHFREPGLERKEGYATGTRGALHGGVTTVLEIQNNPPLLTSPERLAAKVARVEPKAACDFHCYGSLVDEALPALPEMAAGLPAVKCFLGGSTGAAGVEDPDTVRRWFAAAAAAGLMVVAHCEDNTVLRAAAAAERSAARPRHDRARPPEAEVASIRQALAAAAATGVRLHVFHVSTAEGARLVAEAAARGQAASCSTAPHYLLLTGDDAAAAPENRLKVNPSIKSPADRAGLQELLAAGAIACTGTDHAPHPLAEKARPYWKAPSGFPSVDLLLPLMVAVHDRFRVPLEPLLASVTARAAAEFGLGRKGRLQPGADADLVVADPGVERTVEGGALPSRSRWSPYQGWRLRAFPELVFLRGRPAFHAGRFATPPSGRWLGRS